MKLGDMVIIDFAKLEKNIQKMPGPYTISDYFNAFPLGVGTIKRIENDFLIFLTYKKGMALLPEEVRILEKRKK